MPRIAKLDRLLQPSSPLASNAASVPARQPVQGWSFTESTQEEPSFSSGLLFVLRAWWKEWVLVLVAIGILAAITIILRLFNDQPQPNWNQSLNLNTMIAVLATLLRSSLVTVVEEGKRRSKLLLGDFSLTVVVISQAKWSWQRHPRPARHLAHFDGASRGPLGALLLCFNVPGLLKWNPFVSR